MDLTQISHSTMRNLREERVIKRSYCFDYTGLSFSYCNSDSMRNFAPLRIGGFDSKLQVLNRSKSQRIGGGAKRFYRRFAKIDDKTGLSERVFAIRRAAQKHKRPTPLRVSAFWQQKRKLLALLGRCFFCDFLCFFLGGHVFSFLLFFRTVIAAPNTMHFTSCRAP